MRMTTMYYDRGFAWMVAGNAFRRYVTVALPFLLPLLPLFYLLLLRKEKRGNGIMLKQYPHKGYPYLSCGGSSWGISVTSLLCRCHQHLSGTGLVSLW
jgi:hypothetical protein